MLDPSLPWLVSGYRNFQKGDFTKVHSYDDITSLYHVQQEDFIKELQTATPGLWQRRRVKSAISQRQQHKPHLGNERTPRPKSAFLINTLGDQALRPGSSQSYNREKVGCYISASEHSPPQYFHPGRPRAKSAIYPRHRPSSFDQKRVSQVERQFHKERMYSLSVTEGNYYCAFCPNNCRPEPSSSNRPVSSTGLVAAEMATHFDRYTLWTRPRSTPFMKGEFVPIQRPRHNYVNREKVPHYSNFVKRIDLRLRNQTLSPTPLSPRRRQAFAEAVSPAPPKEHRGSRQMLMGPKPDKSLPQEPSDTTFHEESPNPTLPPAERFPPAEIKPPDVVPSAWAKPRVPTPTPTTSPLPEPAEEEPISKPSPPREPKPPFLEELEASTAPLVREPVLDLPREPTPPLLVDPTSLKEPTPPPLPELPPVQEPLPKPKKEVQSNDLPVGEPPLRPSSKNKEKKLSNLVTKPLVIKKSCKPDPPVAEHIQHNPCLKPELVEVKEDPKNKPSVQQAEILSLSEVRVESPVAIEILDIISNNPFKEEVSPANEETKDEVTPAKDETEEVTPAKDKNEKQVTPAKDETQESKKQPGHPPLKIKMDVFGQVWNQKYLPRNELELLDLDIRSRRKGNLDEREESRYKSNDLISHSTIKKFNLESWLYGRIALSKRASRFELPMDVRNLKDMTPIAYLERYCIVNRRRATLYRKAFSRVDKDCDFIINLKEMEKAIEDALINTVHLDQIKSVMELLGVKQDIKIKPRLFSAICALLERLFYHEFVTEDTAELEENTKERVEDADFSALDWKLKGCTVNPPLKKLLYRLL